MFTSLVNRRDIKNGNLMILKICLSVNIDREDEGKLANYCIFEYLRKLKGNCKLY